MKLLPMVLHMQVIEDSMEVYGVTERSKWVVDWPGQAVLCVTQKHWTALVHESIRKGHQVKMSLTFLDCLERQFFSMIVDYSLLLMLS